MEEKTLLLWLITIWSIILIIVPKDDFYKMIKGLFKLKTQKEE